MLTVKNIGHKVVNIAEKIILPGQTADIPDSYEGNDVIALLVKKKCLSKVAPKKPGTKK